MSRTGGIERQLRDQLSRCPQVWHGLSEPESGAKNVPNLWSCA